MNWQTIKNKFSAAIKSATVWFSVAGLPMIVLGLEYASTNMHLVKENLGTAYGITTFSVSLVLAILRVRSVK